MPEEIAGLYIGGGYPEVFAAELEANKPMRAAIKKSILNGLPTYAECGGLMYLSKSIADQSGNRHAMAGVIPGESRMTGSLQRFGYVEITVLADNVISRQGDNIRGHEFHFAETIVAEGTPACFQVNTNERRQWNCGFKVLNALAGYPHLHFWSNPQFAREFARHCREYLNLDPASS